MNPCKVQEPTSNYCKAWSAIKSGLIPPHSYKIKCQNRQTSIYMAAHIILATSYQVDTSFYSKPPYKMTWGFVLEYVHFIGDIPSGIIKFRRAID